MNILFYITFIRYRVHNKNEAATEYVERYFEREILTDFKGRSAENYKLKRKGEESGCKNINPKEIGKLSKNNRRELTPKVSSNLYFLT